MSKSLVFPYGITLREAGNIDVFPAVEVGFLNNKNGLISLFLLVDSGAAISALPKSDANAFGINVEHGKASYISGINGEAINGWSHDIGVKLGERILKIPVMFLDLESAPRVLGRAGVFDKFTIIFEESNKRSGFLNQKDTKTKLVGKILDSLQKQNRP